MCVCLDRLIGDTSKIATLMDIRYHKSGIFTGNDEKLISMRDPIKLKHKIKL